MGILNLFMRKQRYIQDLLEQYMDTWLACMNTFHEGWTIYIEEGLTERYAHIVELTHKEESKADDLRRKIEWELYSKALLPESRGDILGILETADRLLSLSEWTLMEVKLQKLLVPEPIKSSFSNLGKAVLECCRGVDAGVRALIIKGENPKEVIRLAEKVDDLESEADHYELTAIRLIFEQDMVTGDQVLLKNVVRNLGRVADQAESVADRLMISSVKRRV